MFFCCRCTWRPSARLSIKFCTDMNCWVADLFDTALVTLCHSERIVFVPVCWLFAKLRVCYFSRAFVLIEIRTPHQRQLAGEADPTHILYSDWFCFSHVRHDGQLLLIDKANRINERQGSWPPLSPVGCPALGEGERLRKGGVEV